MNILEPLNSGDIETARTQALRDAFLMERVFRPGQVTAHYIPVDRHIIGGIQPTAQALHFPSEMSDHIRTGSLLERREIGVVNLGGPGQVSHDDQVTCLARLEALYLGARHQECSVFFR
jgi:4-deoxy-L-threo-5-hexosulose-uronate ketol-isomerase